MFVKCGASMHVHAAAHRCCQHVTIFSDTSHSRVRRSLSTHCRQHPWNLHTWFHSPIANPSTVLAFQLQFLKQLFLLFAGEQGLRISNSTRPILSPCAIMMHRKEFFQSTCSQAEYLLLPLPAAGWVAAYVSVCK